MHLGKQNHNSGSMHDPTVYQQKTVEEVALKGLKQRISLAVSRIGGKLHWIQAIQSWSMEGAGTVLTGSVQANMCYAVSRRK